VDTVLNYITHDRSAALVPSLRRELCSSARWVLVLALAVGLLGMHVPGLQVPGLRPEGTMAASASAAAPAAHGMHEAGRGTLKASDKRLAGSAAAETVCTPGSGDAPVHAAHCIPAPGGVPPVPPAVVVLDRSDALPQPPAVSVPRAVLARAPTPDLAQLSISRT
jgi:hypothetical protein